VGVFGRDNCRDGVGEEGAPLGLQEVDDPQVLPELFELGTCGGKEVHVGVARPPSLGCQVGHPPDPDDEFALPGVDPHGLAEWFVLEAAGDLEEAGEVQALPGALERTLERVRGGGVAGGASGIRIAASAARRASPSASVSRWSRRSPSRSARSEVRRPIARRSARARAKACERHARWSWPMRWVACGEVLVIGPLALGVVWRRALVDWYSGEIGINQGAINATLSR